MGAEAGGSITGVSGHRRLNSAGLSREGVRATTLSSPRSLFPAVEKETVRKQM